MAILLRNLGHQVETTHDGSEALKIASELQPHAFLVDIGLPVLNGYEVAKRIRQQSQLDKTRLLAVTGYGSPDDAERARKAGFDFHLVKPVSFDELTKLLSSIGQYSVPAAITSGEGCSGGMARIKDFGLQGLPLGQISSTWVGNTSDD